MPPARPLDALHKKKTPIFAILANKFCPQEKISPRRLLISNGRCYLLPILNILSLLYESVQDVWEVDYKNAKKYWQK